MGKMFTDTGFEITKIVENKMTKFVKTKEEAIKLTEKLGYFYPIFDEKKNQIGYGIPK
jgi:hypothetical protein